MKTQFTKMAVAVGALAAASLPAHAIIEGVPAEANLLPLVVHYTDANNDRLFDTFFRITVPKSVGNDVILNLYTAPHTSPTNGTLAAPGSEAPGNPALTYLNGGVLYPQEDSDVHWYFMSMRSEKLANGSIAVTQDDVDVQRWSRLSGGAYNGQPGYLVLVTSAGNNGDAANFSFSVDTWLRYRDNVVSLPTIPMSDGADNRTAAVGSPLAQPTITNNVVEYRGNILDIDVSPLVTGQPTVWSNGSPNTTVIDLALGGDSVAGTLAVVWNDQNAANWNRMTAFRFDTEEESCSGLISLPNELNLVVIGREPATGQNPAGVTDAGLSGLVSGYETAGGRPNAVAYTNVCDVDTAYQGLGLASQDEYAEENDRAFVSLGAKTNYYAANIRPAGFVKLALPEPTGADTGINAPQAAAVTFTIPLWSTNGSVNWEIGGAAILGHFRGAFTDAPN